MDILSVVATAVSALAPITLETIGDRASRRPTSTEYVEFLPKDAQEHRYEILIEDKRGLSEILSDTFYARVRLDEAPPGLLLCVHMKPAWPKRRCDKISYELPGSYAHNDTQEVSIWVFWHPEAEPISGSYKLVVSGV